jgi:tetratricopeptide (TPR) repeat protein
MSSPTAPPSLDGQAELPGEFERLRRFILYHLGRFTLGLVRVNDPRQRNGLIASLTDVLASEQAQLLTVDLSNLHPANLRQALRSSPALTPVADRPSPDLTGEGGRAALAIVGLDHLIEAEADGSGRPPFAAALNIERDALPGAFPLPLILFLTDHAMDRLALAAPDFFDWYSAIFSLRPAPYQPPAATSPEPSRALRETPEAAPLSPETLAGRLNLLEDRRAELARQAGPEARRRLAQVLREMGDLYGGLPEYDERQAAVPYYKQAAEIFCETDDKAGEATALEKLGEVFYWINKYPEATRRYEAALPLYREIGARLGEANCIQSLGDVHVALSELPQARARYEAALPLYREIGARLGEANCIRSLGDVHVALSELPQARARYEAALPLYREIGARLGEANCIRSLGDVHGALSELPQARARYEAALPLYREIGDRLGEANCIKRLGDVHVRLSELKDARARYEQALPIYREIGDRLGEANCIQSLGDVHEALSELKDARARYEQALPIYREIGDRLGEANTMTSFGDLSLAEKDAVSAREWFEQAMSLYADIGERMWQTYVAPRLATTMLTRGDVDLAIQTLQRGAELARTVEGQPNLRQIMLLLAEIRKGQNNFAAARACYDELLGLAESSDWLRQRAHCSFELKDYARALADYGRLLELDPNDARARNGLGNVREKEEDLEGAIAEYSKAIEADPDEAIFVRNRASALITLNRLDEARADCETASRLASDHEYTHGRWGDLHLARGEWAGAEARYQEAIAKTSGDTADWRFDLAMALWGLGRAEAGWAEFNAALAKAGADTRHEAISDYRRLLALHPDLPGLAEAMKRLAGAE